ncbi:MAG: ribosome-associated translation inhibitor RaiA [Verrucomicrobiae bacterium]|nr:ribosome-associated translation inhibitor RaiA [Verrucomicrobiae bacterium]
MSETTPVEASEFPIIVTARHMDLTDSMRDYAEKRVRKMHYGYPRVMEVKVILDSQPHGHIAEIVVIGADNVTIEADTETQNLYEAIDLTMDKIERQMRKEKTRMLKQHGH